MGSAKSGKSAMVGSGAGIREVFRKGEDDLKLSANASAQHIAFLDGIRGLAAMLVVVSHLSNNVMQGVDADSLLAQSPFRLSFDQFMLLALGALGSGAGQVGVMLFFTLSGFLIFHLYSEREVSFRNAYNFLVSRVARIFPLYYMAVVTGVLFYYFVPFEYIDISVNGLFWHALFLDGKSVLWTIAPELVFYISFLLFWAFFSRNRIIGVFGVTLFVLISNYLPVLWRSYTAEFFALGYLLFAYSRSDLSLGVRKLPDPLTFVLFFVLLFVSLPAVYRIVFGGFSSDIWQVWFYPIVIIVLFVFSFECVWIRRFFGFRIMAFLGKISFSVYLLHLIVLHGLLNYGLIGPDLLSLVLSVSLVVLLSSLVFYLFESPSRRWIRGRFLKE